MHRSEEDIIARLESLELKIRQIQERNIKVEADKSWESSAFRVVFFVGTNLLCYCYGFLAD
jgi:hypothetical protein